MMSVIIQVLVYKRTGKRVFRMAPIHHHFEQLGWSEPTVVIRFWIIAFVLALAGLSTLKLQMITSPAFRGKRYAVLGLARSGLATVEALVASGAEVTAWDNREEARAAVAGRGRRSPIRWRSTSPAMTASSSRPACRSTRHPIAAKARDGGRAGDRRHRTVRAGARRPAAAQGRRHHRHQRQVDHHRAGPPHPEDRRRADDDGRQYRPADPRARTRCPKAASMCWSCPATRSTSPSASTATSRCCSTSRPTISTAMTASRPMPRRRRGCSRCSRAAIRAVIVAATSRSASTRYRRIARREASDIDVRHRAGRRACGQARLAGAAGAAQCPECRRRRSAVCRRARRRRRRRSTQGLAHLSRPAAPDGAGRREERHPVRQRQQGDQPRLHRPRARRLPVYPLDCRRPRQERRSGPVRGPARPCPRRLHDRRGRADVRAIARRARCRSPNARCWRRRSATRPGGASRARWSCSRRPAPRSTSSGIMRRGATPSARWWGHCHEPDDEDEDGARAPIRSRPATAARTRARPPNGSGRSTRSSSSWSRC